MEKVEKVKTSISIDKDIFENIKELGKLEDRSFSQQINKILKDYLAEKE